MGILDKNISDLKAIKKLKDNDAVYKAAGLMEQEPMEPFESDIAGILHCGSCGASVMRELGYRFRHCPWCGRRIKWD